MSDTPSRGGATGTYLTSYTFGPPSYGVTQGQGSGWFGPGAPMASSVPQDVVGRQFDFPTGFNLTTTPRAYEPITFASLRELADGYDLLSLVIETRKDQVARMDWKIASRTKAKGDDPRIAAVTKFFQHPDGVTNWGDWLRPLLDDLFVIDAPALYMQRNLGGQLIALHSIDGATIKPVIDDWGRTPRHPYQDGTYPFAYQQILKGLPLYYTVKDLLYLPRNRRTHTPFGRSPVEQIVTTVNIALRRQLSTLNYFTDGNIPDMIVPVPKEWTPDQIVSYQKHWDAYFTGDLGRRRRAKFVPTGTTGIHETRQPDLKGEFDEWIALVVCFAFSVSPQALRKMMNRGSAETQKDLAEEEGLQPILVWIKSWLDDIIANEFGAPDLEFSWNDDGNEDKLSTMLSGLVARGMVTIDEARDRLGLTPFGTAVSKAPLVLTGNGYVPLDPAARPPDGPQSSMGIVP